jgi:hypothetical protein
LNHVHELKITPLFLLVMLFLAACSSSAPVTPPAETLGDATPMADPTTNQPVEEAQAGDADNPVAPPTPRPDLHASDPSTVSLAAGQLQLVEFFAFW